ncbi:GNAT family N-acetyltransferase [Staphylococcus durrellii]|uniref:GNAT family N-acetyltransferase n=1 Tax=Staphylococcus durrellii TaxID=2781773 RepID=UPI00189F4D7C|nr:GNAT family N-acetyltransferase [Staphylococcus durrellii]MBF7017456.1 GNAT family N-acetyltransferase [Staphylococcus durrellii]
MFKIVENDKELEQAFEIRKEIFVKEQGVPTENEIDSYEQIATHVIGYNDNNTPIATARFRPYDNGVKVERVAVLSNQRKSGIGKSLMLFIEQAAQSLGYNILILNAQIHAQPFYDRLGYEPEGDIFMEENIKHIKMTKSL